MAKRSGGSEAQALAFRIRGTLLRSLLEGLVLVAVYLFLWSWLLVAVAQPAARAARAVAAERV